MKRVRMLVTSLGAAVLGLISLGVPAAAPENTGAATKHYMISGAFDPEQVLETRQDRVRSFPFAGEESQPWRIEHVNDGHVNGGVTSASTRSSAQENRAATNIPQVFMAVSQVTNNYLLPDDTRGNPGTYLQVFGDDLPRGWSNSWRFVLIADPEGALVGQLRSEPAGACATMEGGAGSAVYLRACVEGNRNQWWRVRYVPGTGTSFQETALAFVPDQNRSLALTAEGRGDAMVYLRQMWGGQPSLAQAWRLYPSSTS